MSDVERKLRDILDGQLGPHANEDVDLATPLADLGLDSLDEMELVMEVEDEFLVNVPDADAQAWRTVGDVVRYVAVATGAEPAPAAAPAGPTLFD